MKPYLIAFNSNSVYKNLILIIFNYIILLIFIYKLKIANSDG